MIETLVPREMLYIADEVFFSGTAAEITPIRSIDRIAVGKGRRGPVAEALQKEFFGIVHGTRKDTYGWLSPVYAAQPAGREIDRGSRAIRMATSPEIYHPGCADT